MVIAADLDRRRISAVSQGPDAREVAEDLGAIDVDVVCTGD